MRDNDCPSPETLKGLINADFQADDVRRLVDHIDDCETCQTKFGEFASGTARSGSVADRPAAFVRRMRRYVRGETLTTVELFNVDDEMPKELGDYRIEEEIGRGGMGVVYKGWDTKLHRTVAIKRMRIGLAQMQDIRQRILNEARAVAQLNHPNIVSMFAVDDEADPPYFVMEYADGQTLHDLIEESKQLGLEETLRIGAQIADGLATAHENNVIHCDLKPANVLLTKDGNHVRLTDFGVALAAFDQQMEGESGYLGTPHYMSPEQFRFEAVDERSDLFSLGVVLFRVLTGQLPFQAPSLRELREAVCEREPLKVSNFRSDVPHWLEQLVSALLTKDPQRRIQSAREVQRILEQQNRPPLMASRKRFGSILAVGACLAIVWMSANLWRSSHNLRPASSETNVATGSVSDLQEYQTTGRMLAHRKAPDPFIGSTLCTNGDWFAVAADGGFTNLGQTGRVVLFKKSDETVGSWLENIALEPDSRFCQRFGKSMAMGENTLVVGTDDRGVAPNSGSVFVYERNGNDWHFVQKLQAPRVVQHAWFGSSVAIREDLIAVGSPETARTGGRVYLYRKRKDTWRLSEEVVSPDWKDGFQHRSFGNYVSFMGRHLVVADSQIENGLFSDDVADTVGRIYLFGLENDKARCVQVIAPQHNSSLGRFGHWIAWSAAFDELFVSAQTKGQDSASVSIYQRAGPELQFKQELRFPVAEGTSPVKLVTSQEDLFVVCAGSEDTPWSPTIKWYRRNDGLWQHHQDVMSSSAALKIDLNEVEVKWRFLRPTFGVSLTDEGQLIVGQPTAQVEYSKGGNAFALDHRESSALGFVRQPGSVDFLTIEDGRIASTQTWKSNPTLRPWPTQNDLFGHTVELVGDMAFVAAHRLDANGLFDAGRVYVFQRAKDRGAQQFDGWPLRSIVQSPQPNEMAEFGRAMAANEDVLVVFEWTDRALGTYQLLFFTRSGDEFQVEQTLHFDGTFKLGWRPVLKLFQDTVLLGGYNENGTDDSSRTSNVIVIKRDEQWKVVQQITVPGIVARDEFGCSLAIDQDQIVIGSKQGIHNQGPGRVYLFKRDAETWRPSQTLQSNVQTANGRFGHSVALNGGWLAVGATNVGTTGSVYIYKRDGKAWIEHQVLTSPNLSERRFGARLVFDGDRLVVGREPHVDVEGHHLGTSHVFRCVNGAWKHVQVIQTPKPFERAYSGTRVAADAGTLLFVGTGEYASAGAVYAYELQAKQ